MRINRVEKNELTKTQGKRDTMSEQTTFTEIMAAKRQQLKQEKLDKLVREIEAQGAVLAKSRTVEDLQRYKKLVKEFLQDAIMNGLNMQENRGFGRGGRMKIYKIVEEVDKKLVDLADAVLHGQEKGLKILSLVGEIQGLLIDVYS